MIPNISLLIRKVAPIDFTSFANNPQPVSYHQPIFLVLVFASFYKVVVVCLSMICDKMYSFPVVDNPPSPTWPGEHSETQTDNIEVKHLKINNVPLLDRCMQWSDTFWLSISLLSATQPLMTSACSAKALIRFSRAFGSFWGVLHYFRDTFENTVKCWKYFCFRLRE